ncbi:zinc transporter ZIP5 [Ambystoma mexicanum]|uniref:zinc transporter ZIP5 n=1 Tax=Ambystoma mexicanum TaxID=8296 RepID=UPI0037E86EB5
MAFEKQRLVCLPLLMVLLISHCHCNLKPHVLSGQGIAYVLTEPTDAQGDGEQGLQDAHEEQGYYLQQLFLHYGQNGTLSYHGLTNLLLSLGLGQVQVVEIQHDDLGHAHVSHLDLLEVQEQKHVHSHTTLEHESSKSGVASKNATSSSRVSLINQSAKVWKKGTTSKPTELHTVQPTETSTSSNGRGWVPQRETDTLLGTKRWAGKDVLERLLLLDHSNYNHLHEDCLNVSQLLVNFGLSGKEELTPQQFSLICPALLYQIDSRVCIRHHDDLRKIPQGDDGRHLAVLGFGFLAITVISVPSLLAILLVPFLSRSIFHFLLVFLVALAVGTLCGDALLHLLPHAQGGHQEATGLNRMEWPEDSILKGLSVLAGIYLLFLIENILGLVKYKRKKKRPKKEQCSGSKQESLAVLQVITTREADKQSPGSSDPEEVAIGEERRSSLLTNVELREKSGARQSSCASTEDQQRNSGHSHGPSPSRTTGIADIAWMVILGDGIHNFTDGLAIGAAFSQGIPSGLSTSIAVFCHELPHELGDFAVLLQAGMPVRRVMLFSLLSAFLGYMGMFVGAMVSQSSSKVTPWIFAVTAGIFLYVALVDMLPDLLQRGPGRRGQTKSFLLRNAGFLIGSALMLCIALFEHQIQFSNVDL